MKRAARISDGLFFEVPAKIENETYRFMSKRVAIQGFHGSFHEQAACIFYERLGEPEPEII